MIPAPELYPRTTPAAGVAPTSGGWHLAIPDGLRGRYRLAQLDDYMHLPRRAFGWQPPMTLHLRARAADASLPGTWGFGLWNDPFGLSIGFGGTTGRLPALPNAAWFFYASPENHLSLQEAQRRHLHPVRLHLRRCKRAGSPPGRDGLPQVQASNPLAGRENAQGDGSRQVIPANGFFAGTFRSPRWPSLLLAPALLALPFIAIRPLSRLLRRLASQIVCQDAAAVRVDVTQWHEYTLSWLCEAARFEVDGKVILTTPLAPHGPLGVVIWIDNQYAAWTPEGHVGYGTLENPAAWIEIEGLTVS